MINMYTFYFQLDIEVNGSKFILFPFTSSQTEINNAISALDMQYQTEILDKSAKLLQDVKEHFEEKSHIHLGGEYEYLIKCAQNTIKAVSKKDGQYKEDYLKTQILLYLNAIIEECRNILTILQ